MRNKTTDLLKLSSLLAVLLLTACVTRPDIPADVVKSSRVMVSGKDRLAVDFYYPANTKRAPMVIVMHGFLGRKESMSHWGVALARAGMIVAVPTGPAIVDPARNAQAVVDLARWGRGGQWPVPVAQSGRLALVGFSKGGLETIMAASLLKPSADAWVGLDPVDRQRQGESAARVVRAPGLALLADASALNDNGNARMMLSKYGGTLRVISVEGSNHLDAESPRGGPANEKFEVFQRETVRFLQSALSASPSANVTTIAPRKSPSAKPVASSSG